MFAHEFALSPGWRSGLNIVYLHQHFRTPAMNGGTRSYEFARRLVERGHHVDLITADHAFNASPGWRVTEEAGVTVHWAQVPYSNSMSTGDRMRAFRDFAFAAGHRAAGLKQDLVFATSTPLTVALPGVWSKRSNKVPMVFEVRDLWPAAPIAMGALQSPAARFVARRLEAWAYRNAAHVIALSPDMSTDIMSRFPRVHITTVPNGCDTDTFGKADGDAVRKAHWWLGVEKPLIVYAGTIGRVNGLAYLVRMAREFDRFGHTVQIAIIGTGAEAQQVRQLAKDSRVLDRNLHFLPPMPKHEVASWFAAADLGISTVIDRAELGANSANKVFDTWAAGRPVAINHGGWLADIINRTGAGVNLPPGKPEHAAGMVVGFLRDQDRVMTARLAAEKLAHGEFNRDELFSNFAHVLETAAGP